MTELHVVPFAALSGRDHRPSLRCWCGPVSIGRDLSSTSPVYRHRRPPPPESPRDRDARLDFERYERDPDAA